MSVYYEIGDYTAVVENQAFVTASTGKPMIVLRVLPQEMIVDAGRDTEEIRPVAQRYERTIRLVINHENDKSMKYLMLKLRYAGFHGDSFSTFNLLGKTVRCQRKEDSYEGQPTEQWDLALPLRESMSLVHDPKLSNKMDALFGKRLKEPIEAKPSNGNAENKSDTYREHEAVTADDGLPDTQPNDEIPF
jgi:hypothetical protein